MDKIIGYGIIGIIALAVLIGLIVAMGLWQAFLLVMVCSVLSVLVVIAEHLVNKRR